MQLSKPVEREGGEKKWIEAALKRYPLNWAFDATNPALVIDNIISGATAEACNKTGEVESLFSATMKDIHDEAEGALGYPQVCDALTAVRRLAVRVKELEARFEAIEDALEDAGAPGATETKALDKDPIIERIKLWAIAQDSPSELKARADEAERERNVAVFQFNNWKGRAIEAEKERDEAIAREAKMRAILEGAGYDDLNDLDDTLTRDIEDCRRVGETIGNIVENHIQFVGKVSERAEQAEAQLTEHKNKYLHTAEDMELLAATLNKSRADIATQRDVGAGED